MKMSESSVDFIGKNDSMAAVTISDSSSFRRLVAYGRVVDDGSINWLWVHKNLELNA